MLLETDERASGMFMRYRDQLAEIGALDLKQKVEMADFRVNASTAISQQLKTSLYADQ